MLYLGKEPIGKTFVQLSGGGTVTEPDLQEKSITPSTVQQTVVPDPGKDGLSKVTVGAVTASIDRDIQSGNIKKGVDILGVSGEYEGEPIKLDSKTVSPTLDQQVVRPGSGFDGLSDVTVEAMPSGVLGVPTIGVDNFGVITAQASIPKAGYLSSTETKSATQNLSTKGAATITPGTTDKTIASRVFLTGVQTIKGDANLVPEKIKAGESIFGVPGSYAGDGGLDTSDATLSSSSQMLAGVTAYSNGQKYTGDIPSKTSADIKVNLGTVTIPAGHYGNDANISVGTATQATPSIDVDGNGLITSKSVQSSGYVVAGTKSATRQLDTRAGETVTSNQTLATTGKYMTGDIVVNVPSTGIDTSDGTATEYEIAEGKIAYVAGQRIEGKLSDGSNRIPRVDISGVSWGSGSSVFLYTSAVDGRYFPVGKPVSVYMEKRDLGDAKPEEVAAGKYFTSSEGFKIQGTRSVGSGEMPTGTLASPTISTITGVVTASVLQSGYMEAGTSRTLQLPVKDAETFTPGTTNQTILLGKYLIGTQTIKGDPNLVPGNIRPGISIFGVPGEMEYATFGTPTVNVATGVVKFKVATGGYIQEGFETNFELPTRGPSIITPTESPQTIQYGQYLTGVQTIAAIPTTYVGSGVSRKPAAQITPKESVQTIAANQYLTGVQTIAAIPSDYIGSAVKLQTYYTGTTEPASSLGIDGDIYLMA